MQGISAASGAKRWPARKAPGRASDGFHPDARNQRRERSEAVAGEEGARQGVRRLSPGCKESAPRAKRSGGRRGRRQAGRPTAFTRMQGISAASEAKRWPAMKAPGRASDGFHPDARNQRRERSEAVAGEEGARQGVRRLSPGCKESAPRAERSGGRRGRRQAGRPTAFTRMQGISAASEAKRWPARKAPGRASDGFHPDASNQRRERSEAVAGEEGARQGVRRLSPG